MSNKKLRSKKASDPSTAKPRTVTFNREIRKRNISPLSDKPEGVRRMPEDSEAPEQCSISFVEVTENSIMSSGVKLAPLFTANRAAKRPAPSDSQTEKSSRRRRTLDGGSMNSATSKASNPTVLPDTQLPERRTPKVVKQMVAILSDDDDDEISIVAEVKETSVPRATTPPTTTSSKPPKPTKKVFDNAPFAGLIHCNAPTYEIPEVPSSSWVQFDETAKTDEIDLSKYHSRSLKQYLYADTPTDQVIAVKEVKHTKPVDSAFKSYFKAGVKRREELGQAATTTPWIDAFAPHNRNQFIRSCIPDLDSFKTWLRDWSKLMDELAKSEAEPPKAKKQKRKSKRNESDDEDYEEERPFKEDLANTFILFGPTGCGKTSAAHVYGQKAGFNVVEVSASDLRSGPALKKRLSETIKSFAVKRAGGIASFFSPKAAKSDGGEKEEDSVVRKNMVLIDDADVVLSPDKYYWAQLIESCVESRIPIVLTVTNKAVFMKNFSKSDLYTHCFEHKVKDVVVSHLQHWLSGYSGMSFTKDFIKHVVDEKPEDIRRAVGQIEFLSGFDKMPMKASGSALSPTMLADFDSLLGQLDATAQRSSSCQWPAGCRNSETFEPRLNSEKIQVYSYPDSDDPITQDLRSMINSHRPSCYTKFDKLDANLIRYNGKTSDEPPGPIEPAVIDCFYRDHTRFISRRAVAMDELPALGLINRAFKKRLASGVSSRRVLHVFNDVNRTTGIAIDSRHELYKSIHGYSFPDFDPDAIEHPESDC